MTTYRQLLARLNEMSPEDLDKTVTVRIDEEYYGVRCTYTSGFWEEDILDRGHLILSVDDVESAHHDDLTC